MKNLKISQDLLPALCTLTDEKIGRLIRKTAAFMMTGEKTDFSAEQGERLLYMILCEGNRRHPRKADSSKRSLNPGEDVINEQSERVCSHQTSEDHATDAALCEEGGSSREESCAIFFDDNPFDDDLPFDTAIDNKIPDDHNKVCKRQESLSYQPVSKESKSQRKERVEEKEINKEKEEKRNESEKKETSLPSSPSLSENADDGASHQNTTKLKSKDEEPLTEEEKLRVDIISKKRDLRDYTDEDKKLLHKAERCDLLFLIYTLEMFNSNMTEMLPDYVITKKRIKKSGELFEWALDEDIPVQDVFPRAAQSSFLCGYKSFRGADYDWMMQPERIKKILSGFYDDYKRR